MTESVICAVLVALISLFGTVITAKSNYSKTQYELEKVHNVVSHELDKQLAIQNERIVELTREVRNYNNLVEEIPVMKQRIVALEKTTFK